MGATKDIEEPLIRRLLGTALFACGFGFRCTHPACEEVAIEFLKLGAQTAQTRCSLVGGAIFIRHISSRPALDLMSFAGTCGTGSTVRDRVIGSPKDKREVWQSFTHLARSSHLPGTSFDENSSCLSPPTPASTLALAVAGSRAGSFSWAQMTPRAFTRLV